MSTPAVITHTNLAPMAEVSNFEVQLKRAEIMANAPFLPDAFRGNPGAVLIAVELADRLALPVMAVCRTFTSCTANRRFPARFMFPASTPPAVIRRSSMRNETSRGSLSAAGLP